VSRFHQPRWQLHIRLRFLGSNQHCPSGSLLLRIALCVAISLRSQHTLPRKRCLFNTPSLQRDGAVNTPGLSQTNTQRSGMRRRKTLPHIVHCCHVATLSSSSAKHSVPDILGQLVLVTLCKKVTCKLLTIVWNRRQSRGHRIQWSLSDLVVWWLRRLWWRRQLEQTVSFGELRSDPFKLHTDITALNQCYFNWGAKYANF